MPELPEVEVVRRELSVVWSGVRIDGVVERGGSRFVEAALSEGDVVSEVGRRGKFLVVGLVSSRRMVVHLGMTGSLRWESVVPASGFRVAWLCSGGVVVLRDPRGFGQVRVVPGAGPTGVGLLDRLGPEPDDEEFTPERVFAWCGRVGAPVKARLLGQELVAGVGNYLADEVCFRAGVLPQARVLSRARARRLHAAVCEVVGESVAAGGVSVRDYVHVDGSRGSFAEQLRVYGRGGLPCVRCGRVLRRGVVAGRGTVWCASCQR